MISRQDAPQRFSSQNILFENLLIGNLWLRRTIKHSFRSRNASQSRNLQFLIVNHQKLVLHADRLHKIEFLSVIILANCKLGDFCCCFIHVVITFVCFLLFFSIVHKYINHGSVSVRVNRTTPEPTCRF